MPANGMLDEFTRINLLRFNPLYLQTLLFVFVSSMPKKIAINVIELWDFWPTRSMD